MMTAILYLILIISSVIIASFTTEHFWQMYNRGCYRHKDTGYETEDYYIIPQYRKPYRYPLTFFKSYPEPHMAHYDTTF